MVRVSGVIRRLEVRIIVIDDHLGDSQGRNRENIRD